MNYLLFFFKKKKKTDICKHFCSGKCLDERVDFCDYKRECKDLTMKEEDTSIRVEKLRRSTKLYE